MLFKASQRTVGAEVVHVALLLLGHLPASLIERRPRLSVEFVRLDRGLLHRRVDAHVEGLRDGERLGLLFCPAVPRDGIQI